MHRLKLVFFPLFISIIALVFYSFALAEESLSITTFYPSPYGVYNEMRLFPHDAPVTSCSAATEGTMFYNGTSHDLQVCTGTAWGGGGDSLWAGSGADIYNTNTGNVGIGTNVPTSAKLVVSGDVLLNGTIEGPGPDAINIPNSDILVGGGVDGVFGIRTQDKVAPPARRIITFCSEACGPVASRPWPLVIDNLNRRVGIRTLAPDSILQIYGNPEIKLKSDSNPSNYADMHLDNTLAAGKDFVVGNYGPAIAWHPEVRDAFFIRNNYDGGEFIINKDGNVGLITKGSTAGFGSEDPQTMLHLKRASEIDLWIEGDSPDIKFINLPADMDTWRFALDNANGNFKITRNGRNSADEENTVLQDNMFVLTPTGRVGLGLAAPAYQLQLSTNSAAKPTSNVWTVPSDIRVKKNIKPFTDGLGVVERINPVSYKLNGKAGLPLDKSGIGVVAQDIKGVAPYTIKTWKAKLEPADSEETELYDFDSNALTYVLINAVQEQQKQLEDLQAQIVELKRN